MIAEVVTGILDRLKAQGLDIREIGYKDLIDGTLNLTRPAVNIAVNLGDFQKVTIDTWKLKMNISMIVVFQHLKGGTSGEALRKEGIYKILEAIIQSLLLQKLDLELENPLFPMSFRNITTLKYAQAGIQIYQINFWCSTNFTKTDDAEDWGNLYSILAQYYLQPRDYTGMQGVTGPEASDAIGLTGMVL
jgi:hypothetical protein